VLSFGTKIDALNDLEVRRHRAVSSIDVLCLFVALLTFSTATDSTCTTVTGSWCRADACAGIHRQSHGLLELHSVQYGITDNFFNDCSRRWTSPPGWLRGPVGDASPATYTGCFPARHTNI